MGKSIEELVGRSAELDVIRDAVSQVVEGRGRTLLLAGEPGIGKSTLARTASDMAAAEGMAVYWGFSWEAGGAPAYWPWTQLLRSLISERNVDARQAAPLTQILPEPASSDARDSGLQPDQARFSLLESVRGLLTAQASEAPLALILEDLHAADSDSLHLLHYLARHCASIPLLVIGTFRDVEARSSSSTEPLWRASRDATVLRLPRLNESDVRDYLRIHGDGAPDDDSVQQFLTTTAGNPLFLTELVGLLARDGGTAPGDAPLPESVQQVIRQQIDGLPPSTSEALGGASVFGREFGTSELAMMIEQREGDVYRLLQPAIDADVIRPLADGRFRFGHTLYRDVLYHDLGAARRAALHQSCARRLKTLVEQGDADRYSALAKHLQLAGPEHRFEAIAALRQAAARARERLAFEDAAGLLRQAVAAFGAGPKYEPLERCRLLVEYASALLLAGNIDEGQTQCRDAFAIAQALGDPQLMSEVALAWGSAIVVAKVDRSLVAALKECLEKLPPDDAPTRSRVQARLAGALQPAMNPAVPMDMARDAIALARTTGEPAVLYSVLRSAISALMDFAPPQERIALNREFGGMAAEFGDVPQQFRSSLLLMIDASETADRRLLDDAVDACDDLADRIGLPHYQWRAASARAMQAMIDGRFERARALLDTAHALAGEIGDLQAKVTVSIQRFSLLVDWNSERAPSLETIEAELQAAYAGGISDAEFFVSPLLAMYKQDERERFEQRFIASDAFVERAFAGGDRYSLSGLGQMALKGGHTDLAERCYSALLEYRDGCATLGLMGSCWCGPVTYWLGMLADGLGRGEEARRHFREALGIARRMQARPYVARILGSAAELEHKLGDRGAAERYAGEANALIRELDLRPERIAPSSGSAAPAPSNSGAFSMQKDGEVWLVNYGGKSVRVRDSKGLRILSRLVASPETDVHVLDLSNSRGTADGGNAGPMLDAKARDEYRRRVLDLRAELEEAESLADHGRADALRTELDFISRELSRAFGLGGRERAAGNAAERARVNVRRRLRDAMTRIGEQLPDAGRYLETTIKTGRYCRYTPM